MKYLFSLGLLFFGVLFTQAQETDKVAQFYYDNGIKHKKEGDYLKALTSFDQTYQRGNLEALAQYGFCQYKLGNIPEALSNLEKASNKGIVWANTTLGYIYETGTGIAKDLRKASQYYTKSCDGGHATGCSNLGGLYQYQEKDYNRAVTYYKKALALGHDDRAAYDLGRIYVSQLDEEDYDDNRQAIQYLQTVSSKYKMYHWARFYLAEAYYWQGVDTKDNTHFHHAKGIYLSLRKVSNSQIQRALYYWLGQCTVILSQSGEETSKNAAQAIGAYQTYILSELSQQTPNLSKLSYAFTNMAEAFIKAPNYHSDRDFNMRYYFYLASHKLDPKGWVKSSDIKTMEDVFKDGTTKDQYAVLIKHIKSCRTPNEALALLTKNTSFITTKDWRRLWD